MLLTLELTPVGTHIITLATENCLPDDREGKQRSSVTRRTSSMVERTKASEKDTEQDGEREERRHSAGTR